MDSERQPIDTIVIHHTSLAPGITLEELDALQRERLYVPVYASPAYAGQPVASGHMRDGREIFYAYHWLVRQDGSAERLLHDKEIGWHCGDWSTNCRSIAICFDGNFAYSSPTKAALTRAADIMRKYYVQVPKERILGHCEVKAATACPSKYFLVHDGEAGWKETLYAIYATLGSK